MVNPVWEVIIPLHSTYLLVLRVFRPEVTAHQLELEVEMRQPVEQIHPPGRRVVHHGRHLDLERLPDGCHWLSNPVPHTVTGKQYTVPAG